MTSTDTTMAHDPKQRAAKRMQLRVAVMFMAGGGAAQRRNVQLGHVRRSYDTLLATVPQLPELTQANVVSEREATALRLLGESLEAVHTGRDDFLAEPDTKPREYLWGNGIMDESWAELRRRARAAFSALREPARADGVGLGSAPTNDRWLGGERAPGAEG